MRGLRDTSQAHEHRGGNRRWRRLVAAGLAVTALTACTGDGGDEKPAAEVAAPAQEVWRLPITAVGQTVVAGDVAVVYTTAPDGAMQVVAIDPAVGKVLWSKPASSGSIGTGQQIAPGVVPGDDGKDLVAYLEPFRLRDRARDDDDGIKARIVVADPRTGRAVARSQEGWFTEHPEGCRGSSGACALRYEGEQERPYRLALPSKGARGGLQKQAAPAGDIKEMSGDYVFTGGAKPAVSRRDGSRVLWTVPLRTMFGADIDPVGWRVRLVDDDTSALVASMPPRLRDGVHDIAEVNSTAAIDAKGKVLWRAPGTVLGCFGLSIRNSVEEGGPVESGKPTTSSSSANRPLLRCRYRDVKVRVKDGSAVFDPSAAPVVEVESVDLLTGRTRWKQSVGREPALQPLAQWRRPSPMAGVGTYLVGRGRNARIVEPEANPRVPDPRQVLVCRERRQFDYEEPYWIDGQAHTEHDGGLFARLCTPDGATAQTLPPFDLLAAAGAQVGDTAVLATSMSIVGYR